MGEQVTFNKNDFGTRNYLPHAGKYGTGLDYDADIVLSEFKWNSNEDRFRPGFSKNTDTERHWAHFGFRIIFKGQTSFINHHEQIDKGARTDVYSILMSLDIPLTEDSNGDVTFNTGIAPRKVTGLEVGDPRQDPEKKNPDGTPVMYTGRLTGVKVIG